MTARLLPRPVETRCFCCAAAPGERADTPDGWATCAFCGARSRRDADQGRAAAELARAIADHRFPALGEGAWFVDTYTARIAATGRGHWLRTDDVIGGHDDEPPRGRLVSLSPNERPDTRTVGLVALARPDDPLLPGFVAANRTRFYAVMIVLDGAGDVTGATVVNRALDGDFGAQRNAGMAASAAQWAFHLDLDETVDDAFAAALSRLAAHAERAGLAAVGFARRNRVDGVLSDHFPDVQYRLVQRDQRFVGRVHERPAACASWPRTTIALHGAIDHHLERARIARRHALYERLGQQGERQADMAALLRPFRP